MAGADTIYGGGGTGDSVWYYFDPAAVTVNFGPTVQGTTAARTAVDGWGAVDSFPSDDVEGTRGSTYADRLFGSDRNETFSGDNGNDTIRPGNGNDVLYGDNGDDDLRGGGGNDTVLGGSGVDTVNYGPGWVYPLTISLDGVANDSEANLGTADVDNIGADIEGVIGGSLDDVILGSAADNYLDGGAGNDVVVGNYGVDEIHGGTGQNILIGGDGSDYVMDDPVNGLDIFILGYTTFDSNLTALRALQAEWGRTDISWIARATHLVNGGGLNGTTIFSATTVHGDDDVDSFVSGQYGPDIYVVAHDEAWDNYTFYTGSGAGGAGGFIEL